MGFIVDFFGLKAKERYETPDARHKAFVASLKQDEAEIAAECVSYSIVLCFCFACSLRHARRGGWPAVAGRRS